MLSILISIKLVDQQGLAQECGWLLGTLSVINNTRVLLNSEPPKNCLPFSSYAGRG